MIGDCCFFVHQQKQFKLFTAMVADSRWSLLSACCLVVFNVGDGLSKDSSISHAVVVVVVAAAKMNFLPLR